ncbi:hypothetical protein AC622_11445 [Bacillus sp. FJAT-27916]|uniref:hypothetical protein n=1 Tax=Bacillus sp. FJAT-27916 TaxID=1679169 RepID=UPI000671480C|nr:hypothetical protein [Bacillus sp. FJAT-27916]KMY44762.1 hypothetical protein AC622_11445 [Bacillus sp. FJAT-27916]
MKTNHKIYKGCFQYPVLFFTFTTMYQWLVHEHIRWIENTGISIMMVFVYMFINWVDIPYKWKKKAKVD